MKNKSSYNLLKAGINLLFLLFSMNLSSQSRINFSLDKIIQTNIEFNPAKAKFQTGYYNGFFYMINTKDNFIDTLGPNKTNKCIKGIKWNLKDEKNSEFYLFLHVSENSYFSITPNLRLGISEDYIAMQCYDKQRILKKIGENVYTEYSTVGGLNEKYDNNYIINNKFWYCSSLYNFDINSDSFNLKINFKDLTGNLNPRSLKNNKSCGIGFTMYPNQYIDIGNRFVAIADLTKYSITILNSLLNVIDTIEKVDTSWVNLESYNCLDKNKSYIEMLDYHKNIDDSISRIEKIFWVSDTSLLIVYKHKNFTSTNKRALDYWVLDSNNWRLKIENIVLNYSYDSTTVFMKQNSPPSFHVSPPFYFFDKGVVTLEVANIRTNEPINLKEYKNRLEKIQPYKYSICIYKFKLD